MKLPKESSSPSSYHNEVGNLYFGPDSAELRSSELLRC